MELFMKPYYAYWIFKTIHACPVCGRGQEFRERRPLPKPEDPSDRYLYEEIYDWCDAL